MRRWKIVLAGVVAVILLIPVGLHFRAKWRLQAYRDELKRQGEKLEVSEIAPPTDPKGLANGAQLLKANNLIGGRLRELAPATMEIVKPGKARVSWREEELIQSVDPAYVPEIGPKAAKTNIWQLIEPEVLKKEQQLEALRRTMSAGSIQYPVDYANLKFSALAKVKTASLNLGAATVAYVRRKDTTSATASIVAMTRMLKNWEREPLLISQLVRTACANIASFATWEALQGGGLDDAQLKSVQQGWEGVELLTEAEHSIEMEEALCHHLIESARQNFPSFQVKTSALDEFNEMFGHLMAEPKAGLRQMVNRYPRYWGWCWVGCYDTERKTLEVDTTLLREFRKIQARQPNHFFETERQPPLDIDFPAYPWDTDGGSFRRAILKFVRQQTHTSLTVAAIALERYRLQHGAYPKSLAEMVPAFLQRVPIDYGDGKEVRYRLNTDATFLLYGVGDNGVDDGGNPTTPNGEKTRYYNGKDFVWPQAATADEVKAFEEAERKSKKN
jgi:hypothetical protein